MDTMHDNASERTLASELIKANQKAEAAETERLRIESERLKQQSEHYQEQVRLMRDQTNVLKDQADRNMEAIATLHDKLDHVDEHMSGHTHETGVRIYRNVEAVIRDEQKKQTTELKNVQKRQSEDFDDSLKRQTDTLTQQMKLLNERINKVEKAVEESNEKDKSALSIIILVGLIANLIVSILLFLGITF
ncbi:MAG: hypothetical protein IJQ12_06870 [Lachnospiraceae bacterium]|nr:hypothetical protein [Lachnospiraceae bacterium]